jgi:ribonuclease R
MVTGVARAGRERRLLLEQLARLTVRGQLAKVDREHWSIPKPFTGQGGVGGSRDNLCAGPARPASRRLRLCAPQPATGSASRTVLPAERPQPAAWKKTSSFLPNEINSAMQGDQVLVEVESPKADGRQMGRIVRAFWSGATRLLWAFSTMRARTVRWDTKSFPLTSE